MKLRKLWHSVRGYEGLYQVSNFGEIRSLSRWKHLPNGQYTVSKEKLLSPAQIGKDGYKFVYLTVDGKSKRFYVHLITGNHDYFVKRAWASELFELFEEEE